jgi:hypothetical protein
LDQLNLVPVSYSCASDDPQLQPAARVRRRRFTEILRGYVFADGYCWQKQHLIFDRRFNSMPYRFFLDLLFFYCDATFC